MKGFKGRSISDVLERRVSIIILVILIIALIITTISSTMKAMKQNQTESIVYKESSLVDYRVNLKQNEFFESDYLGSNKQYIASLINHVEANFKYNLNASDPNIKHKYAYKIIAETNVVDKNNQNSIYKLTENLIPENALETNNSYLQINENIRIDYNKYNELIKKFVQVYNLNDIVSTLTINMYVNVDGITKQAGLPVATLVIPLTTQTMAIDIESNAVNATEISVYKEIAEKNHSYIAILTFILTIMIGIELYIFTRGTKDELAMYKTQIKKILLNYDSYIQKTYSTFNYDGYQQIEMKSFEDLLQIRDTISQPILMIEKEVDKETHFLIPSKGQVIYIYKLKVEDFKEKVKKNKNSSKK